MSRTRAERRYNSHLKTTARKALAIRGEIDRYPVYGYCGGKIGPDGEARSCQRCQTCRHIDDEWINKLNDLQLNAFMKTFQD